MERDGHVRLLPLHVANKIAAGEVVERPASVLKELMENALDAGASRIEVLVVEGGRKLVSVRDDGCGMSREDALLSLERQATSKIRDVDDIERIDTLGFRGEAIPSIAAVSRFTMITRRRDSDEATILVVNAGTLAEVATRGAPAGTQIDVRDLFCNVPARRKFLRAYATEEAQIKNTFIVHALAHPTVGFSLVSDGRELYRLPPGATINERIRVLFGEQFADRLIPVSYDSESAESAKEIHVKGFIERPGGLALRHDQFVFINGRPASAPAIAYALKEGYPRQPGEARPAAILFLTVPPSSVDVNVHPAKREVRFRNVAVVREALIAALARALSLKPEDPIPATPNSPSHVANTPFALPKTFVRPIQQDLRPQPPQPPAPNPESVEPAAFDVPHAENAPLEHPASPITVSTGPWRWFKFLATTQAGFLLVETDAGIVTLNPLAARERIAFEALLEHGPVVSQPLLIPQTIQLSPLDSARVRNFADVLAAQGFSIEEFGPDTWKIDAMPQLLGDAEPAAVISSIARDIAEAGAKRGSAHWREELVAKSVARAYSGASKALTPESASRLVEELSHVRMPYVDPRGKPVMIFVSNAELLHKFAR